ncbi:acyltransferase family protein [Paenibacillus albidus]|uniref:acyltransferase family protein n=1 Tax=Paenibacillus albidus TaxID=2041023 RepID=UPI001BE87EED|nr:acyltransferase family protein [Paenibacillus albidus]MBT2288988.1 acyltransferase family protein [Paenibacillus albidus]
MSTLQKKPKRHIAELVWLRTVACLMIVAVHAVESVIHFASAEQMDSSYRLLYPLIMFMKLATPLFIFISAFLLAHAYHVKTPEHFLRKRAKYLLIPYVIIAVVYAVLEAVYAGFSSAVLAERLWKNIVLAEFHGYFILTIFQFYILHQWIAPYLNRWKATVVIPVALVINAAYLAFFNLMQPFAILNAETFWQFLWWVPFPAWVFYYVTAYYAGRNVEEFRDRLSRNRLKVIGGSLLSVILFFILYSSKILPVNSSKNVIVLIYALPVMLLMFYLASVIRSKPPTLLNWIASLSFGIFLLHSLCQKVAFSALQSALPGLALPLQIIVLFVAGAAGAMLLTYMISLLPFGTFIIGKINLPKRASIQPAGRPTASGEG